MDVVTQRGRVVEVWYGVFADELQQLPTYEVSR